MSVGQGEGGSADGVVEGGGQGGAEGANGQTDTQGQGQGSGTEGGADGADALGDAGKRALEAERARADAAEKQLKQYKDAEEQRRRDALSEAERASEDTIRAAVDAAKQEVRNEYEPKLKRLAVQAQAAERFVDPEVVASLVNITAESTDTEIKAELDRIAKEKPYLVKQAGGGPRIGQGVREGGAATGGADFIREAYNNR